MRLALLILKTRHNAVKYNNTTKYERKTDNLTPITVSTKAEHNRYSKSRLIYWITEHEPLK